MRVTTLDHLVLTVSDIASSTDFYTSLLGMSRQVTAAGRVSLHFGSQKINLHRAGAEFLPKAARPSPGSADLCFLIDCSSEQARATLVQHGIDLVEGPVPRQGAAGALISLYVRDPDGNLIELACLATPEQGDLNAG